MKNDYGSTIKTLSSVFLILGILASIGAAYYMTNMGNSILVAIIVFISGCFASWFNSVLLSGFGQLITDTRALRYNVEKIEEVYYKEDKNLL